MGGTPLESFEHPERAIYILGAEDHGLPGAVVKVTHLILLFYFSIILTKPVSSHMKACAFHVALPSVREASYNVAVAGSILMYDRFLKEQYKLVKQNEETAENKQPFVDNKET